MIHLVIEINLQPQKRVYDMQAAARIGTHLRTTINQHAIMHVMLLLSQIILLSVMAANPSRLHPDVLVQCISLRAQKNSSLHGIAVALNNSYARVMYPVLDKDGRRVRIQWLGDFCGKIRAAVKPKYLKPQSNVFVHVFPTTATHARLRQVWSKLTADPMQHVMIIPYSNCHSYVARCNESNVAYRNSDLRFFNGLIWAPLHRMSDRILSWTHLHHLGTSPPFYMFLNAFFLGMPDTLMVAVMQRLEQCTALRRKILPMLAKMARELQDAYSLKPTHRQSVDVIVSQFTVQTWDMVLAAAGFSGGPHFCSFIAETTWSVGSEMMLNHSERHVSDDPNNKYSSQVLEQFGWRVVNNYWRKLNRNNSTAPNLHVIRLWSGLGNLSEDLNGRASDTNGRLFAESIRYIKHFENAGFHRAIASTPWISEQIVSARLNAVSKGKYRQRYQRNIRPLMVIHRPLNTTGNHIAHLLEDLARNPKNIVFLWPKMTHAHWVKLFLYSTMANVVFMTVSGVMDIACTMTHMEDPAAWQKGKHLRVELFKLFVTMKKQVLVETIDALRSRNTYKSRYRRKLPLIKRAYDRVENMSSSRAMKDDIEILKEILAVQVMIGKALKGVEDADKFFWAEFGRAVYEVCTTGIFKRSQDLSPLRAATLESVLYLKTMDFHLDPSYTLHVIAGPHEYSQAFLEEAMRELDCQELIESVRVAF